MKNNKLEEQFLQLYQEIADALYRHCYFRVYTKEKAEELVQEAFLKTWEYLASGASVPYPKALVYKIANNLIIDSVRKKKEQSLEVLQEQGFDPSYEEKQMTDDVLDGRILLKSLLSLDEEYREVVSLRFVDDLSPKEIASILGVSANVVSVRIHRGVKKLKEAQKKQL